MFYKFGYFILVLFISSKSFAFGINGPSGRQGSSGSDGSDGESRTIFARSQNNYLDLSGRDGDNGYNGLPGDNAYSCVQNKPAHNVYGANGGNGGSGGAGGDGGNGGDATVYFTNLNQLRRVVVVASGGYSADGGYGAPGGYGCSCQFRRWKRKVTQVDGTSVRKTFYCTDGADGSHGSDGARGSYGNKGQLTLVKRARKLIPIKPEMKSYLSSFTNPVLLSRNVWEKRRGALDLLGAGSTLRDNYWYWIKREEKNVSINWNVNDRSINDFRNEDLYLKFDEKGIHYSMQEKLWYISGKRINGTDVNIDFQNMFYQSEVENISPISAKIDGKNTTLTVTDEGEYSHLVNTKFYVEAAWSRTDARGRGALKRWKDYIPNSLVKRNGNTYTIELGKLPIKDKYFKKKIMRPKLKMQLTVVRSLENWTTSVGVYNISKTQGKRNFKVKRK